MAEKKGKQATKGTKQIMEENVSTLKFYRNMALGANSIYFLVMFLLSDAFTGLAITMTILSVVAHVAGYQFLAFISKPKLSETGATLDSGVDLNMEGGISEHVKDLIILNSGTQLLVLLSSYFWLLWLLVPIRTFWMLWGSIIQPWMSAKSEQQQPELDEKKQKKMDRKMRRMR